MDEETRLERAVQALEMISDHLYKLRSFFESVMANDMDGNAYIRTGGV